MASCIQQIILQDLPNPAIKFLLRPASELVQFFISRQHRLLHNIGSSQSGTNVTVQILIGHQ